MSAGHKFRIVSLAPTTTEIICALGLGPNLVGVTTACDYPPEVEYINKIGPVFQPDYARIEELKPDLVVAHGAGMAPFAGELMRRGLKVELVDPRNVEEVMETFQRLGLYSGAGEAARLRVQELKDTLDRVHRALADLPEEERPLTVRMLEANPPIIAGPASFMTDVIRHAGGRNPELAYTEPYVRTTEEEIAAIDPEVVYVCGWEPDLLEAVHVLPGWNQTRAAKTGRIYSLPCGLACRPGARVGKYVEMLAAKLHPDRFPEKIC
ncbi:MAG: ABC transporter substrate-binding protein [Deltaproteobacteria bacterium]|nr:ABC transporter substrate-binding protein [Deltaproteobacteria bacterium]